jgi:hypothetical protein
VPNAVLSRLLSGEKMKIRHLKDGGQIHKKLETTGLKERPSVNCPGDFCIRIKRENGPFSRYKIQVEHQNVNHLGITAAELERITIGAALPNG